MFIDNSNLFHGIRGQGTKKMDYVKMRDYLADGRSVDVRFYYSEPINEDDSKYFDSMGAEKKASRDRFYRFLEDRLGFYMIRLPLRLRSGYDAATLSLINYLRQQMTDDEILRITGQKSYWIRQIEGDKVAEEKGLDCEIVYDMAKLSRAGHYDGFILVAGDEDYARSIRKIRLETGLEVELAFFGAGRCSLMLQKEAADFTDLNSIQNLFKENSNE